MSETNSLRAAMERYFAAMRELVERDAQIRALLPKKEVQEAMQKPGLSLAEIADTVLRGYADRTAMGERSYDIALDPQTGRMARRYLPAYSVITYDELRRRVEALACAWRNHERHRVNVDDFICIFGFSGIDFTVVDLAASYVQATTVPLQTSLASAELENIVRDTAPVTIFATAGDLLQATQLAIANGVKSVVAIEYDPRVDEDRTQFEAAQAEIVRAGAVIELTSIQDLIDFGSAYRWEPLPPHAQGLERLGLLIHSSGSTGTPKGAMLPERGINFPWLGTGAPQMPTVTVAFAPLNHFLGRSQIFSALTTGGIVYYTPLADLSLLFDDFRLARPTSLYLFPRVIELIHQHYHSEVSRRSAAGGDSAAIEAEVRAEMKAGFLGDRLQFATWGGAPMSPETLQFMCDCFDIMLIEGYGSTESGLMTTLSGRVIRPHVIDYKLRDVPELGYYTTDKPYPRGELLVKSKAQALGFYKMPEVTAAVFDADGYVVTGDIMEERGPDHLVHIDRRNDVLKLSQAEFVAVGALGATYENSPVMKQVYIYGNSAQSFLLAVVVPDVEVVAKLIGPNYDATALKALIRDEMQKVAHKHKLRTFELPRDFIIEMEPFSIENGLLTSVRKRSRPKLKAKYGERLEAMYAEIERKRQAELDALKDPKSPLTVLQKVVKVLESTLGTEGIDPETTMTFRELGGDSLGTVSFSMFLQDIFGVELPVNAIVSPAGHPRRWAQMIENMLGGGHAVPTSDSIHGKDAKVLHAKDLDIDRFLDAETRAATPAAPSAETRTVLLTGANGFLGRFLCLGWMEQVAPLGGKVICLIRAGNDEAARKRLDDVFCNGVDADLEGHYRALAAKHLEVLAGDIAEPNLGLSPQQWERLANEVDHIVHPGALVNHVLSYANLFGPNIFGTAELIRLALTKRQKRFDFVSSLAAAYRTDTSRGNNEDSPLLEICTLSDSYADGYGASKWANEVTLHSANRRYGLPINIFRGDMMMPHSVYKGQINVPDMFTRMLYSVVMTQLAPASFYEPGPDGKRAKAHYDGLPTDFLAGAMIGIGLRNCDGIHTYNVMNHHHDDGVSLDSVIDWVMSAGYAVERVSDHGQWLKRFEAKLGALTEAQRQHSSIAILDMFRNPHPVSQPLIGCEHFIAAVRELPVGPEVPHLSERYIHKYLEDMRCLGLIDAPEQQR